MPFNFEKILVIGATSGIGKALAEVLISEGKQIIAVGRRKDRLDELVSQHGQDKVTPIVFDITQLDKISAFTAQVTEQHPNLDCVLLNSGIQRGHEFAHPETVNLSNIQEELTTNYVSYVHLTVALLPHLQKQNKQTALIYVSSGLALVPALRCGNYSATKAALHSFILVLREQLKDGPGNVKVVEIYPPSVETELHDSKHQPDLENVHIPGMPLENFTKEAWSGLSNGDENIPVGMAKNMYEAFENIRRDRFAKMTEFWKKEIQQRS